MSRLEKAITIFSAVSQCAAALCDYRATHRQVEAARDQVEDLRARNEQLLTELAVTRDSLAKPPMKPPPAKCKKCGKKPCKCK